MPEYPKEQMWKIYEQLPDELKDAIFSGETAENIGNICESNGIDKNRKISEIARLTGHVLLGLIPPDEFQEALEKEVKLKSSIAKKISLGIYRFVFYPVKESLSALYQMKIEPLETPEKLEATGKEEEKKRPEKKDVYRETFE